jgi:DNA-binding LacI/PurR family transcriptional regulator
VSTGADSEESASVTAREGKPRRSERLAPTIYDIARVAGVNPSTVSRALGKPGRISAKTEERIRDAAAKLNYQVNPMARALPTGRTNTIALIVADITNPMFFDVVRGVERAAVDKDFTLLLSESAESADNELRAAARLMRVADGIMLVTSRLDDEAIVRLAEQKPVVVVNREVAGVPGVVADVDYGIAEVIRHLVSLGHRSIAYIAGPTRSWMSERRWKSIEQRCEWSNVSAIRIEAGVPTVDGGRAAATDVLASGVTAAIAYNDLMAIGLMQEVIEAGLSIPTDLSIVGFDNIFGSDFTTPPLTTIMSPLRDAGALAFAQLLNELDGKASFDVPSSDSLVTRLIIRGSTGPAHQ